MIPFNCVPFWIFKYPLSVSKCLIYVFRLGSWYHVYFYMFIIIYIFSELYIFLNNDDEFLINMFIYIFFLLNFKPDWKNVHRLSEKLCLYILFVYKINVYIIIFIDIVLYIWIKVVKWGLIKEKEYLFADICSIYVKFLRVWGFLVECEKSGPNIRHGGRPDFLPRSDLKQNWISSRIEVSYF